MDNGKLALSSGSTKAQDDIWFYCVFDKLRVYTSDYGFNFRALEQRPTSFFLINRALITSTLKNGIEKYTNDLKVNSVDVGYDPADDNKQIRLLIDYSSVEENKTEVKGVTFV
jgi:hypothetical protein